MEHSYLSDKTDAENGAVWQVPVVMAEVVPEPTPEDMTPPSPPGRRVWLPVMLFIATGMSTYLAGVMNSNPNKGLAAVLWDGLMYSAAVMAILLCHEMGHFVQACRYGVYASLPYFIPMPFSPIGTFGAVIAMEPRKGDRRAVFDIGISGPLAGLVPTILLLILGLHWSEVRRVSADAMHLGNPLLVQWLVDWVRGPLPPGHDLLLHPVAFAAWVGLLVTSLNLLPVGQLDGGHILYGLVRQQAHWIATLVLMAAVAAVVILRFWWWVPMLVLLVFVIGTRHPPTANDQVPLGWFRHLLGWLTLAFLPLGFTPIPFGLPQ